MIRTFHELVIGDVLISPFVTYAGTALLCFLLLRPLLARVGFEQLFSVPPVALLAVYVLILVTLIIFF